MIEYILFIHFFLSLFKKYIETYNQHSEEANDKIRKENMKWIHREAKDERFESGYPLFVEKEEYEVFFFFILQNYSITYVYLFFFFFLKWYNIREEEKKRKEEEEKEEEEKKHMTTRNHSQGFMHFYVKSIMRWLRKIFPFI